MFQMRKEYINVHWSDSVLGGSIMQILLQDLIKSNQQGLERRLSG